MLKLSRINNYDFKYAINLNFLIIVLFLQPVREVCGKAVPVVAAEIQNQILEEGYSIEKAKLMKEKEEIVDKIIFRERVKQKHRVSFLLPIKLLNTPKKKFNV